MKGANKPMPAKKAVPVKTAKLAKKTAATGKKAAAPKKLTPVKVGSPVKKAIGTIPNTATAKLRRDLVSKAAEQTITPTAELVALIGVKPLPRLEARKRIWEYVRNWGLVSAQGSAKRITLDAKLEAAFLTKSGGGKGKGGTGNKGDNPGPSISLYAFKKLLKTRWG